MERHGRPGFRTIFLNAAIGLNGILLVSTVMNFQTIRFADNNDLPLVLILPSYATTAWYHKRLSPQMQAKSVEQIAQESRQFAANEFMPALLRIDSLSASERSALAAKFSFPDWPKHRFYRTE